jgi:sulfoxide reductase catalytic subunit YedY
MLIKIARPWEIPEQEVTPEDVYMNRRQFIKRAGLAGIGAWGLLSGYGITGSRAQEADPSGVRRTIPKPAGVYPVDRNHKYDIDRPITDEVITASYNNYYEFTTDKGKVWQLAERFETRPWQIEVTGHVARKRTFDIDEFVKQMPLEERVYRHRCVEAWSMVVPWAGVPFRNLIDEVQPTSKAKYVRVISFLRPGQRTQTWYPWPYFEGLTLGEATNELTMLVTGIYGHELPKQNGAPIRLVTPWKYGYKSIKSIVRIEFVDRQPPTFWNKIAPNEYGFFSNVNPKVPHPRWSQATEQDIGTGKRMPTLPYNGYGEYVASLYS